MLIIRRKESDFTSKHARNAAGATSAQRTTYLSRNANSSKHSIRNIWSMLLLHLGLIQVKIMVNDSVNYNP